VTKTSVDGEPGRFVLLLTFVKGSQQQQQQQEEDLKE
jgi:hypothetical protein